MYPEKIYENPTIRTGLNNLINFEAKTPPFSGVWGGHTSIHNIFFFIQNMKVHDLRMSNVQKKNVKKIPIVSPLKYIFKGYILISI